jgi:hypothetical protein
MARDEDDRRLAADGEEQGGILSRRQMLSAGLAAAGASLAGAQPAGAEPPGWRRLADPESGTTAAEFRARFAQTGPTGEQFVAYGYLTKVQGAGDDDLFSNDQPGDATALLTAYAAGQLVRRTVDQSVHSLDIEGTLTIYQRSVPGASFADPDSFQVGTPIAQFEVNLQDIVTVFAPGKGLPTLTGDLRQVSAHRLDGSHRHRTFGRVGAEGRLFATGIGTLLNPATFNSILEMAGQWTVR